MSLTFNNESDWETNTLGHCIEFILWSHEQCIIQKYVCFIEIFNSQVVCKDWHQSLLYTVSVSVYEVVLILAAQSCITFSGFWKFHKWCTEYYRVIQREAIQSSCGMIAFLTFF